MDCKTVSEQLLAYLDGAERDQNEIARHLQECHACEEEYAAWAQMTGKLKAVEFPDPGEPFWRNFTESVTQAIAQKADTPRQPWKAWTWEGFQMPSFFPSFQWAMAAAVMVVVIFGIERFSGWRTTSSTPRPSLSLSEVVHLADWSDPEGATILLDLMEDDAEEMDFMIGSDIQEDLLNTESEGFEEV